MDMQFGKFVDDQNAELPASLIIVNFNYRRRFNPETLKSFAEDIKANKLLSAIIVRQLDDGSIQLLAGQRRLIAFKMAFGDDALIPVKVRIVTDEEAVAIMMSENGQREDPSIIEDAEGASRMLGLCNGDRDEAAARLSWERPKLDRRLALMNATQSVRDAYIDGKLGVGHVEVLAAFRSEVQETVLKAMLASPEHVTVEQLKKMGERSLMSLEAAIFNKADCENCQFSTGVQQAMFETSFDGLRCTNRECYDKKTEGELTIRHDQLVETYQVVRIVRPGDNNTVTALRAEGDKGVGEEQAKACRTCGDFGACVSAVPDSLGKAYKDICFNGICHGEKVAAQKKALRAAATQQSEGGKAAAPNTKVGAAGADAKPGKGDAKAETKEKPSVATIRQAVKDYREEIWRKVFVLAVGKLPVLQNRALLITLLMRSSHYISSSGVKAEIQKGLGIEPPLNTRETADLMLGLAQEKVAAALQMLPAAVTKEMPINDVTQLLTALKVNIANYWQVNETFLDILTKTEIDAVCVEIGVDQALGKTYGSLKNGSKKAYIAAVLKAEGFEFRGKIPALMRWKA